jgi:hypothetical protein
VSWAWLVVAALALAELAARIWMRTRWSTWVDQAASEYRVRREAIAELTGWLGGR